MCYFHLLKVVVLSKNEDVLCLTIDRVCLNTMVLIRKAETFFLKGCSSLNKKFLPDNIKFARLPARLIARINKQLLIFGYHISNKRLTPSKPRIFYTFSIIICQLITPYTRNPLNIKSRFEPVLKFASEKKQPRHIPTR